MGEKLSNCSERAFPKPTAGSDIYIGGGLVCTAMGISCFQQRCDRRLRTLGASGGCLPFSSGLGVTWPSSFRDSQENKQVLQEQIVPLKEEATPKPGCSKVPEKERAAGFLDPVVIVT